MLGKEWAISETLVAPDEVRGSNHDEQVNLYYRWYNAPDIDNKYICAVVRIVGDDALVMTVYPTDRIKEGDIVWRKSP